MDELAKVRLSFINSNVNKVRTLNLIELLKDEEIDTRYAFNDLKEWVIKTERRAREAVDFIEKEYQEIEYKETEVEE